ncbi:hypothetical protein Tco_0213296 [Tanacetum coccineum]
MSSVGRKSNVIFGRKLKIGMAAYGWKVRTSPRRVDPGAPASDPLLTGSSLLAALFKAREDDERHQESRQDRSDQIMHQQVC